MAALLAQLVSLTDQMREKNASIRRLRRVAFGPSSDRRHETPLKPPPPKPHARLTPGFIGHDLQ